MRYMYFLDHEAGVVAVYRDDDSIDDTVDAATPIGGGAAAAAAAAAVTVRVVVLLLFSLPSLFRLMMRLFCALVRCMNLCRCR